MRQGKVGWDGLCLAGAPLMRAFLRLRSAPNGAGPQANQAADKGNQELRLLDEYSVRSPRGFHLLALLVIISLAKLSLSS